jgi:hypothetical protein
MHEELIGDLEVRKKNVWQQRDERAYGSYHHPTLQFLKFEQIFSFEQFLIYGRLPNLNEFKIKHF